MSRPPVYLTVTVINHLRICEAARTLIVPLWISAQYWISLCKDRVHWNDFIHDWMNLRPGMLFSVMVN